MKRVLVVDDSSFMRTSLTYLLESDEALKVVAAAVDGADAVRKVKQLRPDVAILDLEMREMDGLAALAHIMAECPTPVLVLSGLHAPALAVKCLEHGAVDFIPKPSGVISYDIDVLRAQIIAKVKLAAGVRVRKLDPSPLSGPPAAPPRRKPAIPGEKVVVIGASTGGPRAIAAVLAGLPPSLAAAVLVVQHMSPAFIPSFADRLRWECFLDVAVAREDEPLTAGRALLAPGGCHTLVESAGGARRARFSHKASPHALSPSVDYAMESAAAAYGDGAIGVLLTGMGSDGALGLEAVKDAGGATLVEDASTCLVYGMPKAALDRGCVDQVVPLPQMARAILRLL